jgi:hypothetical protein
MLPNKTIIRSIYVDDDKIYSGSIKNLGIRKKWRMNYVCQFLKENRFLTIGK